MERHDLHAFIDGKPVLYEGCKSLEAAKNGAAVLLAKLGKAYGGAGITKFQQKEIVLCHLASGDFCSPADLQAIEAKAAQEASIAPEPSTATIETKEEAPKAKKAPKKGKAK